MDLEEARTCDRGAELSTHDIRAFLGVRLQQRLADGQFSAAPSL
jgi:hypothetical protein